MSTVIQVAPGQGMVLAGWLGLVLAWFDACPVKGATTD
jgi:hypothetical protein